MEVSPFPYQGPIEPAQVRGRDELVADLIERVTERRVTALLGPRRYGKTSVLRRVAADIAATGASVVWVDLYEVTSAADLAVRLDQALRAASGSIAGPLVQLAAAAEVNLGMLKLEFARRRDERPDPATTVHVLLDTLVTAAERHPCVVVFDEFPGIVRVEGAAGLLRTKLQHHFQQIGLVFAGSQPSLMRAMFSDPKMPFYSQADLVPIDVFSVSAVAQIVAEGFAATGRDPGDLAASIHTFAGGHPHRSVQLADAAWRLIEAGETYTPEVWAGALDAVRIATELGNEAVFSGFAPTAKAVLRLVANRVGLFSARAELLGVATGQTQHARDALIAAGELEDRSGLRIVDPVFADWIRRRFPA
ncbi:hypothetical protein BH23ACT3_BH23ACT3_00130 [soil metagenome]